MTNAVFYLVLIYSNSVTTIPSAYSLERCHELGKQWREGPGTYRAYACVPQTNVLATSRIELQR